MPAVAEPTPGVEWLALGPASRMLGVDPDTLRRWADTRRIATYSTPGGHRRFSRRALEELMSAPRGVDPTTLERLGATTERLTVAYRRGYGRGRRSSGLQTARTVVPPSDHAAFRQDGRELVDALVHYLEAADQRARSEAEAVASRIVADLGRRLGRADISLTESVAAFVGARRPLLTELGSLARGRALPGPELARLLEEASAVLDRLLLEFIAHHQTESVVAHA